MNRFWQLPLVALLAVGLAACEHDHGSHDHGEDVDQIAEGCKHMEFGPDVALEAGADAMAAIETVHTRYDMTLVGADGSYDGAVQYTSAGGMHYLLLDQAVDFAITDGTGAAVEPSMIEADPTSCALAASAHHVMLPAGTYDFAFTGAATETLRLVVHVEGHSHDH